jgi:hypothetical protein
VNLRGLRAPICAPPTLFHGAQRVSLTTLRTTSRINDEKPPRTFADARALFLLSLRADVVTRCRTLAAIVMNEVAKLDPT